MAGGNCGLRAQPARHCRVRLIQTRRPVNQFLGPLVPSCLSNSWPGISHWSPSWLHPLPPPAPHQNSLAFCCGSCSPCGSAPPHVSPIVSLQQWLIDRDAKERRGPLRPFWFFLFLSHPVLSSCPVQVCRPDTTDLCARTFILVFFSVCSVLFALRRHISCVSTRCSVVTPPLAFLLLSNATWEASHYQFSLPVKKLAYLNCTALQLKATQIFYRPRLLKVNERKPLKH